MGILLPEKPSDVSWKEWRKTAEDVLIENEKACPGGKLLRGPNGPFCAYRPEMPKRIRMDWGKFGKALLIIIGVVGAVGVAFVPIAFARSGNPALEIIGAVMSSIEILLGVAYFSGALEFK